MGDNMSDKGSDAGDPISPQPKLRWTKQIEKLLTDFADTAACYKWLHDQSFRKYKKINYFFNIPIIILSTLSGAVSVGMSGYVPAEYVNLAQLGVGAINITNGIISTLLNFFRYAQLSESHNNAYVGWSRLHRNIKIELSVERRSRKNPNDFIKVCRSEYDRLMEQQPLIPKDILTKFRHMSGQKPIPNLVIPDEAAEFIPHTEIYEDHDDDYDSDSKDDKDDKKGLTESQKELARKNWKVVKNSLTKNRITNAFKNVAKETKDAKEEHTRKVSESKEKVERIINQKLPEILDSTANQTMNEITKVAEENMKKANEIGKEVAINIDQIKESVSQGLKNIHKHPANKFGPPPKDDIVNVVKSAGASVKSLLSKFDAGSEIISKIDQGTKLVSEVVTAPKKSLLQTFNMNTLESKGELLKNYVDQTVQEQISKVAQPLNVISQVQNEFMDVLKNRKNIRNNVEEIIEEAEEILSENNLENINKDDSE